MSKIGKKNILIPKDSSIKIEGANLTVTGPKGTKKLTINEIAESKNLTYLEILTEIEAIVYSGTKLDLSYMIDDIFDEESKQELHEYLIETKSDDLQDLCDEFNDDFEDEDLRLFRIYFYCKVAF